MSTAAPLQNTAVKPQQSNHSGHKGLLQRQCACGSPASSLTGECEGCKSKKGLHAKLTIGASNDPLEQEADRVADQVLAAPLNSAVSATPPRIQRFTGQSNGQMDTAPASVDRVLAGSGRPLEPTLRQDMEQRFGHDFSKVRVHCDAAAEQSALDVNAHAYTVGDNIVFGAGQFAPETYGGRHLLAHELTHVVQQSGENIPSTIQRKEENNEPLAAIQGLPMYNLLDKLSKLPENILDDEEAGGLVGGPRLVTAMRAVRAKNEKGLVDFLTNNKRGIEALPPDQAADILRFLAVSEERTSQKTVNTDLEVDVTIIAPSNIRLPGELKNGGVPQSEGTIHSEKQSSSDAISEFEEYLLDHRGGINGVVLDPETREIIGYRTSYADGISRLVDREGEFVVDAGIPLGLETPVLDPTDLLPNPASLGKGIVKAGANIAGKIVVKGALKKSATSGGKVTLGAVVKMRNVAKAIANKAKSGLSVWPKHHAFPKYLGGAADQTLKKIPRKLHYQFHSALDKFKGGIYRRSLTAKHFEKMDKNQVIADLTEFYRTAEGGKFAKYLPDFLQAVKESGF